MAAKYMQLVLTPAVQAAQGYYFGKHQSVAGAPERDPFTDDEAAFIAARDGFYMATTNADGWPYVQHRGGPPGFLKVLGPHQLGFADFKGNRQVLATGNLDGNDGVLDARKNAALADQLTATPELRSKIERLFLIEVVSFDWNCPQYITPRFTEAEVAAHIAPLKARIAELEAKLAGH